MAVNRREFMQSVLAAGAGLAMTGPKAFGDTSAGKKKVDTIDVGIIGVGAEGTVLVNAAKGIPGLNFVAVCDIWDYSQKRGYGLLRAFGHKNVRKYKDYKVMLDDFQKKKIHMDAVIIATPDFMHAEHAIACMQAGLHVYCEKEMSNSLEKARAMVKTSHDTKRLLQIGHQRRSNPRYIHAVETLIHKTDLLGRVTHANAMWNRAKTVDIPWPRRYEMNSLELKKWGYDSMHQFRNWRWYKKYGGGPIVDLGSHQIDIFSWVFGCNPKSVIASGGIDFYHQHEWYDNVMCIYEYENELGTQRAFYETLTTSKHGGFHEVFMGINGTIVISEVPPMGNVAEREAHAPEWDVLVKQGLLNAMKAPAAKGPSKNTAIDVRVTAEAGKWPLPIQLAKPAHQPHLENFFNAIRLGEKLNCPGEIGYETAVAVLTVNEAVRTNKKIHFTKEQFHV